ncbi:MAG: hypothetical protein LPK07_07875 [Hymenobacteraceae bacterium]|nr:hypothetical protein [Hymenobacteraceae bacterium]
MTKIYKTSAAATGVFVLALLMYCLRQEAIPGLGQLLTLVLLYAAGIVLGVLARPVAE